VGGARAVAGAKVVAGLRAAITATARNAGGRAGLDRKDIRRSAALPLRSAERLWGCEETSADMACEVPKALAWKDR
jgi:hypothetical protein